MITNEELKKKLLILNINLYRAVVRLNIVCIFNVKLSSGYVKYFAAVHERIKDDVINNFINSSDVINNHPTVSKLSNTLHELSSNYFSRNDRKKPNEWFNILRSPKKFLLNKIKNFAFSFLPKWSYFYFLFFLIILLIFNFQSIYIIIGFLLLLRILFKLDQIESFLSKMEKEEKTL